MVYLHRKIEPSILKAVKQFSAVLVTGPRQSGKTTLLLHLFSKSHRYVSLDDPDFRKMAKEDPKLFLKNHPPPLIIDEIQYAPELLPLIKMNIDLERDKKGYFILTGSQQFSMMKGVSESLAGRVAVFTLLNFSFCEQPPKNSSSDISEIKQYLLRGGFPELIVNSKMDRRLWFNSYLQTYLERDVRQLRQIGDLSDFHRFMELLAANNGEMLHLTELSNNLGVAVNTVKAWISILEASHQIILVKPYYRNKGKRIVKSPKCYFMDTGFLCHLSGITENEQTLKGVGAGQRFECLVLGELSRYFYNAGEMPRIFFWRTASGEEVDFIVEIKSHLIPIEVKMSSKANPEMINNLNRFMKIFRVESKKGILINLGEQSITLGENIRAVPFADMSADLSLLL